ncbi:hypothetical protein [Priestia megaterium]|uniref:hypothetical protein n=1 Tax=Priestia megaterium TaxID=1404 RepID=UPI00112B0D4E|nr:hypothetical protein [Priestia megaterium]TPF17946.1 hypothetical protein CBE78_01610 [Priestia megaterium]TPF22054.1 hypothetical protein CBE79_04115 [Priestia megaterium]
MAKVFQFQQQGQEECECDTCSLVGEYYTNILNAENEVELFHWVSELTAEAKKLATKEALIDDIAFKAELLEDMESELD